MLVLGRVLTIDIPMLSSCPTWREDEFTSRFNCIPLGEVMDEELGTPMLLCGLKAIPDVPTAAANRIVTDTNTPEDLENVTMISHLRESD